MERIDHNQTSWIHIENLAKDEVRFIKENFSLHPLVIVELLKPIRHSKVSFYNDHFLLVLHFPVFDKDRKAIVSSEIDIIAAKNTLITTHFGGPHDGLDKLFKDVSASEELKAEFMSRGNGFLLYKILERMFNALFAQLDHVIKKVDVAEKKLLRRHDTHTAAELSALRSEAANFRRTIKPNSSILKILSNKAVPLWGENIVPYFVDLESTNDRLFELIDNEMETLSILYDTNQSLVSNRLNAIIKTLTIFSVIVFPLTLFASIWGMNVEHMPIVGSPYDFWIIIFLMAAGALSMLIFFKLKKWI